MLFRSYGGVTVEAIEVLLLSFDADTEDLSFPGAYERAGAIAIEHRSALPCTVVALMPSGELEERT